MKCVIATSVWLTHIRELIIFISPSTLGQHGKHLHMKSKHCKASCVTEHRLPGCVHPVWSTPTLTPFHTMSQWHDHLGQRKYAHSGMRLQMASLFLAVWMCMWWQAFQLFCVRFRGNLCKSKKKLQITLSFKDLIIISCRLITLVWTIEGFFGFCFALRFILCNCNRTKAGKKCCLNLK